MDEMLARTREGDISDEAVVALYQRMYALAPEEFREEHERLARRQLLEEIQSHRRPTTEPVTVYIPSRTRGLAEEETTVRWISRDYAHVHSTGSVNTYVTSEHGCTCPDFTHRRSRDPELAAEGCRHMQALRLAREEVHRQRSERARLSRMRRQQAENTATQADGADQAAIARVTFSQVDWTNDAERERVLAVWDRERNWDGISIARDDQAWQALLAQAKEEWEYRYENVLGETGNTFGLEIEVEFESYNAKKAAIEALYEADILAVPYIRGYHSSERSPDRWTAERDGSLNDGVEFVSPILTDRRETWENLEKMLEILREHAAYVSHRTGGHIHIGLAPMDHRPLTWQNLARVGVGYEHQFFAMGAADSEAYRQEGRRGRHRGDNNNWRYASAFQIRNLTVTERRRIFEGEADIYTIRNIMSPSRYTIFNATNSLNRPTIEFRYPNGSLDPRQWQAHIIVANAMVHQAARPHNRPPDAIPSITDSSRILRWKRREIRAAYQNPEEFFNSERARELAALEEQNFRYFLDFLAHPVNRLAATWLWERGRIYAPPVASARQ